MYNVPVQLYSNVNRLHYFQDLKLPPNQDGASLLAPPALSLISLSVSVSGLLSHARGRAARERGRAPERRNAATIHSLKNDSVRVDNSTNTADACTSVAPRGCAIAVVPATAATTKHGIDVVRSCANCKLSIHIVVESAIHGILPIEVLAIRRSHRIAGHQCAWKKAKRLLFLELG